MKKLLLLLSLFLLCSDLYSQTAKTDTSARARYVKSFTSRSDSLNLRALKLATPNASKEDLSQAIGLIMQGLHNYARFRDSIGLRETFDHLAFVYRLQKQYVQAKWFFIQSNTFSRELKDTANIVRSLINLAAVKGDINDFELAGRDLAEAAGLAKTQKGITAEVEALHAYAAFYQQQGNMAKSSAAAKRAASITDSVAKTGKATAAANTKITNSKSNKEPAAPSSHTTLIIFISALIILLTLISLAVIRKRR